MGLLDIFSGGSQTGGLLQSQQAAYGIDPNEVRKQAMQQALLQAASGMLQGRNLGTGLAGSLGGFAQGYSGGRKNAMEEGILNYKMKQDAEQQKRQQDATQGILASMQGMFGNGVPAPQGPQPNTGVENANLPAVPPAGGFDKAVNFVLNQEGGYVENDAGHGPTNFGINSQANPDVDVKALDKNGAIDIYKNKYWAAIDGDNLPPDVATVAFDTAVNNGISVAKQLLQETAGQPDQAQKIIEKRRALYGELAGSEDYKQYGDGWNKRMDDLASEIGGGQVKGLLTPGNIDLNNRPVVKNADGRISTVRSASFNIDGKEVLLPTVTDDGRILDERTQAGRSEIIGNYRKTGKHLGIFDNPDDATAYAQQLHEDQAAQYAGAQPTAMPGSVAPPADPIAAMDPYTRAAITATAQDDPVKAMQMLSEYYQKASKPAEENKAPSGYRWTSQGNLEPIPGGPATRGQQAMQIDLDGDGNPEFSIGGSEQLTKPTTAKLEQGQWDAQQGMARLDQIDQLYKPEYQTLPKRLSMEWSAWKEKGGGMFGELDDATKQQLTEFSDFKRTTIDNLNITLKEMSGAAITPQESERLKAAMPDPGTGLFDGDSPTEFKAKLDSKMRDIRNSIARYNYARSKGLEPLDSKISIHQMPEIIRKRGDEMLKDAKAKNPNATEDELRASVVASLKSEFGI